MLRAQIAISKETNYANSCDDIKECWKLKYARIYVSSSCATRASTRGLQLDENERRNEFYGFCWNWKDKKKYFQIACGKLFQTSYRFFKFLKNKLKKFFIIFFCTLYAAASKYCINKIFAMFATTLFFSWFSPFSPIKHFHHSLKTSFHFKERVCR
jgi:hypothetical protein